MRLGNATIAHILSFWYNFTVAIGMSVQEGVKGTHVSQKNTLF